MIEKNLESQICQVRLWGQLSASPKKAVEAQLLITVTISVAAGEVTEVTLSAKRKR